MTRLIKPYLSEPCLSADCATYQIKKPVLCWRRSCGRLIIPAQENPVYVATYRLYTPSWPSEVAVAPCANASHFCCNEAFTCLTVASLCPIMLSMLGTRTAWKCHQVCCAASHVLLHVSASQLAHASACPQDSVRVKELLIGSSKDLLMNG